MDVAKLRAWWFDRQGLGGGLAGVSPANVLERTGWARSVGGANPYLTLFARAGISREAADQAVADMEIHELPSARGCTYVVPRSHFGLALKLAHSDKDPQDVVQGKKYFGVTDAELANLAERVLEVLEKGPLDPKEMKEPLGDAVRGLGEEGKKRGLTTTLPMVLGQLQTLGKIRRIPVNGRLDNQRFKYALWKDWKGLEGTRKKSEGLGRSHSPVSSLSAEEANCEFARLFFRWIGPASKKSFEGVSGLGVKASGEAMAPLGLVPLEEGSDLLMFPEDWEAIHSFVVPKEPRYALASNLDNLTHLRWGQVQTLVDEADRARMVFGSKGAGELGGLTELESHAIYDRGRLIGVWEFDGERSEIAWQSFVEPNEELRAAVSKTEAFGRDQLGDIRSFSLDSPESRKPRIEQIRHA